MIIIIFILLKGSCVLRKQLVSVRGKAGRSILVYKLFLSQIGQCKRRVHNSESRREKIVIVRDMTFSFSSGSSPRESRENHRTCPIESSSADMHFACQYLENSYIILLTEMTRVRFFVVK